MLSTKISSLFALALASRALAETGPQIASYLEKNLSPKAQVYLPSNANYSANILPAWNTHDAPTFVVGVKPATEVDIQKTIKYASQQRVPFLARGGTHSYTTTVGSVHQGIDIDMGLFDTVDVDPKANTMTIGGSVKFGNVTEPVFAAGREIPVGDCSCVGMLGATLGGGVGPYSGLHGLMIDSLLSVRIITGSGKILTASTTQNADLFWGLRGAGHNFGIVTSATYKVYPISNGGKILNADMNFKADANETIFNAVKYYADGKQPNELFIDFGIAWNNTLGGIYLTLSIGYAGPEAKGRELLKPFLDAKPVRQNITVIDSKDLEKQNRFGVDAEACIKGRNHDVFSNNLYKFDVPTWKDVFNDMANTIRQQSLFEQTLLAYVQYPNKITKQIPDDSTAYPWRNALGYSHIDIPSPNPSVQGDADTFGRRIRSKLTKTSGASSGGLEVYTNFAAGDETAEQIYGARKLPRLRDLKKKYDPQRLFIHFNPF